MSTSVKQCEPTMSKLCIAIVLFWLMAVSVANAQNIQISMSPKPSPYLSDWETHTETLVLIVQNSTGKPVDVKIKTQLFNGKEAVIAETDLEKMPVLTIPAGVSSYHAEDIYPINDLKYDNSYKDKLLKTGRLPDDNYRLCVSLADPKTGNPLTPQQPQCKIFTITAYQAPILLSPRDKDTITLAQTKGFIFKWTPLVPTPKEPVNYRLQVWEILPGQDAMRAFLGNKPIVEKDFKAVSQAPWPPDFELPRDGMGYVWSIQAFDAEGRPWVDNGGRAEPREFFVKEPEKPEIVIKEEKLVPDNKINNNNNDQNLKVKVNPDQQVMVKDNKNQIPDVITEFWFGGYKVEVPNGNITPGKSPGFYSGTGNITLWEGGPTLYFGYFNIRMQMNNGILEVIKGESGISYNNNFMLAAAPTDGNFATDSFKINPSGAYLTGKIEWVEPLSASGSSSTIVAKGILSVSYLNMISGVMPVSEDYTYNLNDPFNFSISISKNNSSFSVKKSQMKFYFSGDIGLPMHTTDIDGNRLMVKYTGANNLTYFTSVSGLENTHGIRLIPNTNITFAPSEIQVDFSDAQSPFHVGADWKGVVFNKIKAKFPIQITNTGVEFNQVKTKFSKQTTNTNDLVMSDNSEVEFGTANYDQLTCRFQSSDMMCNIVSVQNLGSATYKTFKGILGANTNNPSDTAIVIHITTGCTISNSFLRGYVLIPFTTDKMLYKIPINQNGLAAGYILPASLGLKTVYNTIVNGKTEKFTINIQSAVFNGADQLKMNVLLDFQGKLAFNVNQAVNLPSLTIWSNGLVAPNGILNQWYDLPAPKTATFKKFNVSLSKIEIDYDLNTHLYKFTFDGGITLSANLASYGGATLDVSVWMNSVQPGVIQYNSTHVSAIAIVCNTSAWQFNGTVNLFEADPIYGEGFKGDLTLKILKPAMDIPSTVYIGQKDRPVYGTGSFGYWFVQSGFSSVNGVPLGDLPIAIHGFTGRAYYHMKHNSTPWDVTSTDFVPNESYNLGLMALVPLAYYVAGNAEAPKKFWGKEAFEIVFNNNNGITQVNFYSDGYCMSGGYGSTDAKVKFTGVIGYYSPPSVPVKQFLATLNATVNFPNKFCGTGGFAFYLPGSGNWYFNLGSKVPNQLPGSKIAFTLFCKNNWPGNAYFMMNPQNIMTGFNLNFNSGTCYLTIISDHLEGTYSFGFGCITDMTVNYNPFQFNGQTNISGYANIGCRYRVLKKNDWHDKNILSGNFNSNLDVQFPDPLCIAGNVHASVTITGLGTHGFDCGMRWKNGSFSTAKNCN
jgi:hypothetical protein